MAEKYRGSESNILGAGKSGNRLLCEMGFPGHLPASSTPDQGSRDGKDAATTRDLLLAASHQRRDMVGAQKTAAVDAFQYLGVPHRQMQRGSANLQTSLQPRNPRKALSAIEFRIFGPRLRRASSVSFTLLDHLTPRISLEILFMNLYTNQLRIHCNPTLRLASMLLR
jgi:hypothetical protein